MTANDDQVLDHTLVGRLQGWVANRMTTLKQERAAAGQRELQVDDEQQVALSLIRQAVLRHTQDLLGAGRELPDPRYDQRLADAVRSAMYGAGPELDELLRDAQVENIDINGCDEVWVTYADHRGKVRGRAVAATDDDLISAVQTLAGYAGLNARPFTPANPQLDLRLPDGSRLAAVMTASERPVISVRRNRFPQMFLDDLVRLGTVDEQTAAFLRAAVLARCNVMIAGATDAGKTGTLRALVNCIPRDERIITVERALELGLRRHPELHADVVEFEEVLPDADGHGGITIAELVRRTRRHNPSRVLVGEVMGPEVVEMMTAMSQGNNGSLSTVHARDAADVFHKIATYGAQHEHLGFDATHALIASSIDFVVYIRKNPLMGNRRCVAEILEVTGLGEGRVARSAIFTPSPVDGRAVRATDVAIMRAKQLAAQGYDDTAAGWEYR